jgi:hypothetical protein
MFYIILVKSSMICSVMNYNLRLYLDALHKKSRFRMTKSTFLYFIL